MITVHNGVAAAPAAGAGAELRAELGLDPDALVVAQVAVLRRGQGARRRGRGGGAAPRPSIRS